MKKIKLMVVFFIFGLIFFPQISQGEQAKDVTGSVALATYNQYIFRGYEIGKSGLVIQPSMTVSLKGFSATLWGNMDTNQRNTKTATFNQEFKKGWNETDLTLSYTHEIKNLSITGGYIYYGTKYADETEEVFVALSYKTIANPTITVYRDITNYKGTYINLGLSHSFPVYKEMTIDLASGIGYFIGESDYWKTYERSTATYTGSKYRGFHDGMVKMGLTIPVKKVFLIQPTVQYWFPLSSDAKREYPTPADIKDSYNPNGPVKYNLVYGVGFTYNF
ncbi:MAG TPA: hypothetical protein PK864_08225 [Syntrophorhabdaceae bacterium]|nr:hypothetical protein [Syntrophorhabdaceae bacterium]HOT41741.1 hypothetical protein [Syntrophorhabdaceae bacterium]HQH42323.1 hypothetical protein [Syntrophorhabdaceae bacterium]HQK45528.1 hypothetical protein [Syntrophorhabdaceae bacterium]HRR72100.1 hypothetical protein [Syntrophorhabdaceae bacterium]